MIDGDGMKINTQRLLWKERLYRDLGNNKDSTLDVDRMNTKHYRRLTTLVFVRLPQRVSHTKEHGN